MSGREAHGRSSPFARTVRKHTLISRTSGEEMTHGPKRAPDHYNRVISRYSLISNTRRPIQGLSARSRYGAQLGNLSSGLRFSHGLSDARAQNPAAVTGQEPEAKPETPETEADQVVHETRSQKGKEKEHGPLNLRP